MICAPPAAYLALLQWLNATLLHYLNGILGNGTDTTARWKTVDPGVTGASWEGVGLTGASREVRRGRMELEMKQGDRQA